MPQSNNNDKEEDNEARELTQEQNDWQTEYEAHINKITEDNPTEFNKTYYDLLQYIKQIKNITTIESIRQRIPTIKNINTLQLINEHLIQRYIKVYNEELNNQLKEQQARYNLLEDSFNNYINDYNQRLQDIELKLQNLATRTQPGHPSAIILTQQPATETDANNEQNQGERVTLTAVEIQQMGITAIPTQAFKFIGIQ